VGKAYDDDVDRQAGLAILPATAEAATTANVYVHGY